MSHIREKEELLKIKNYIEALGNDIDIKTIEEILNKIVPKNQYEKNMIGVIVTNQGNIFNAVPGYVPSANTIVLSRDGFKKISSESAKVLCDEFNIKDTNKMTAFYQMFGLLHEVEHAYQFLISNDKIQFKYKEVKDSYKGIIDEILLKKNIIPNPIKEIKSHIAFIKYQKNCYDYILERNAEVEAAVDTSILARETDNEHIANVFESLALAFKNIGYEENNKGCVYQTYKGLLLSKKYNKIEKEENIEEEERLRFGLEINENTRKELIKRIENNKIKI